MMWGKPFRDTWLNIFDSPNTHFYINDCIVDFETGLIFKDEEILWEAANESMVWTDGWPSVDPRWKNRISRQDVISERMKKLNNYFKTKIENTKNIKEINEGSVLHLLHPFNRYVFGHLFDSLQKLSVVEDEKLNFDSFLISKTHEIIGIESHFKALKIENKKRYESDGGLIKVKRLIYIPPPSHPTSFTPKSFSYIRRNYSEMFGLDFDCEAHAKIFLTRRKGKFKRYLKNDIEVEEALAKIGVITLDGTEDFLYIAQQFSKASHVAGVHGSLFTNNIYGNSQTKYLEYCPRTRENHTFHHQFKICKNYSHTLVDSDDHHNVILEIEQLLNFYS